MINIPLYETDPDMDMVEKMVSEDLSPAANDFRIFWDNAYSIHHLYEDDQDVILELLTKMAKKIWYKNLFRLQR